MARDGRARFQRRRLRSRVGRLVPYLVGLGVAVVVAALGWLVLVSSVLGAHDVRVEGLQTVDPDRVREQAGIEEGSPLATLDTGAVGGRVEELPRVASVSVRREWPRGVTLEVRERMTVAVVEDGDRVRGIDGEGVDYRAYASRPEGVPVIALKEVDGDERDRSLEEAVGVLESLDGPVSDRVRRVEVAGVDSIDLLLGNGDRVRWGSAEQSGRKSRVLQALLDVPATVYDVSAPDHPATSRE